MNLDRVSTGKNVPDEINVIIEIPAHSDPVKYEVDYEYRHALSLQLRLYSSHTF